MPINFSSENYSKNASDFYQSIQEEKMNSIFKDPTISDLKKQAENRVDNASFALQYGMAAGNVLEPDQVKAVTNQFNLISENLFSPLRFDPTEIVERINSDNIEFRKVFQDPQVTGAGKDGIRIEGSDRFTKTIQGVLSGKLDAPSVLNSRHLGWIPDDIGGTFFDLSREWSRASYMNAMNASLTKSIAGQTPETLSRAADLAVANNETMGAMEILFDMIDEDQAFLPTYNAESVLRQKQALSLQQRTEWDRDGFFLWENIQGVIPTWLGGNEGIGQAEASFGLESPVEEFLTYEDKIWVGSKDRKGIRDLLAEAIETSENIDPKLQNWLSSNPEVLSLVRNSKNGAAFVAGLNRKKYEYKLAQVTNQTDGSLRFGTYAKIFGHGFTLDPFLGLDLVAGGGFIAGKILAKGLVFGTRLTGAAIPRMAAKITRKTPLTTNLGRMSISSLRTESRLGTAARLLDKGQDNLSMLQKLMPSQIFSELLFPIGRRILSQGTEEGVDLWRYLKNNEGLPKTATQRAMYRAMAGSLEGLAWGRIEYGYATAYEDSLNAAMFGQEEADTIAYLRNQSGMMMQSMLMGGIMGGALAPAIGGAFDGVGAGIKATAGIVNKWADSPKSNWLQKTSAFAEKTFDEKIAKTSWWGVTKSIINIATENNITADARLSVNKAMPVIDFGPTPDQVTKNATNLEKSLFHLAEEAAKAKVVDFQKAVDTVVKRVGKGETINADEFAVAVEAALADQVEDRRARLGWRHGLTAAAAEGSNTQDAAKQRLAMTLDDEPAVAVGPRDGDSSSLTARRAAERVRDNQENINSLETQIDELETTVKEQQDSDTPDTEVIEQLNEQITDFNNRIEELELDIADDIITVQAEATVSAQNNLPDVIKNQAVFNKLLGKRIFKLLETETITPISAMMVLGLDENLVRKLKLGTTPEQAAVLNRMLSFEDGTFTSRELELLQEVINENFLEVIAVRDDVVPHSLFDALIREGVSQEAAFEEAYNFQFEELTSRQVTEDVDVLVDKNGDSIVTKERQEILDKAIEESRDSFVRLEEGDISGFNFGKMVMEKMAEALGLTKKFRADQGPKLIKEAWDKATKEQKMAFMDLVIDKAITDEIYKSKQTQSIETLIRETINEQAAMFLRREKQKRRNESKPYQRITLEISEFLRQFRELQKDKDLMVDVDEPTVKAEPTEKPVLSDRAKKQAEKRNQNVDELETEFNEQANKLGEVETREAKMTPKDEWPAGDVKDFAGSDAETNLKDVPTEKLEKALDEIENGTGRANNDGAAILVTRIEVGTKGKKLEAKPVRLHVEADDLRAEIARRKKAKSTAEQVPAKDVPASKLLEMVGTEKEKQIFKDLEAKQKKIREEIDDSVVNDKETILNNKIRLASERIALQNRPAIGFVRPLLKAFQSFNGHAIRSKTNPKNVAGSIETEFSFDISVDRSTVLGILKANNVGPMIKAIDEAHGVPGIGLDKYDTKLVLDVFQDKLVQVAPSLRDVFIPGLERIYDRLYNTKIEGTGLYKGDGSIRNLLNYLDDTVLDGEVSFYTKQFKDNNERYFNEGSYSIDESQWNQQFSRAIDRSPFGDYFKGDETPDQKINQLLNEINSNLPEGRKIKNFNELGSTLAALDPQRAARAVRSAVLSDKATASSVDKTELVVKNARREARRTLGADRSVGIQKETDTQLIDMFDQFEVQRRQAYLLNDDLTDADIDKLEAWLQDVNINMKDIPNRVRAENSLLPTPVIKSLTTKLPRAINELVELNKENMLRTVPALMSAIHDAILPMYDTSISTDGKHYSWNYSVTTEDGSKVYPLRGLGFGNPIADARPDTFNAAIAAATEITFNYEGLLKTGFATWETGKWRNKLSDASKKVVPEDISFAEFFFGDTFNNLSVVEKTAISKELFPKIGEFDADASGNNVVVSIVNGVDGAKATREFLSTLVEKVDAGMLDDFIESNYLTTYERTKDIIQNDLANPTQVAALKRAIKKGEADADIVSAIEIASAIFNYTDENGNPALDLKAITKNPGMTAPYGASAGSMALAIKENFFKEYKQTLIDDVTIPIDDQNFERLARVTATLLANGFHENSAKEGLSWVNKNLFGDKAKNISNKSLRETMTKFRQVKKEQAGKIDLAPAGETIKNPTAASSLVMSNQAKNQELQSFIPQEANLSNTDNYHNLIRTVMGTAYALTNNGFYKNEKVASESIGNIITKMTTEMEDAKSMMKDMTRNEEFAELKQLWAGITHQKETENIKLEALNSFVRQGHKLDEVKFNEVLRTMGLDEFRQDIMDNMSPMGKKSFTQAFYRELALGAGHQRMYTKNVVDLLPMSGEMLRPDKSDPYSIAGMVPDDLNPETFDANIRRLTLLDLARKAASFVGDENMPEFEGGKFEPTTYDMFMGQWKRNSELAVKLREGARNTLSRIENLLNTETDKNKVAELNILKKMLSKIIDSAEGSRDSSVDVVMKKITGSENKQQVNAMPGALGYLPKTFLSSFQTAPASILRKAQLEKQESVKTMKLLQKQIQRKRVTVPEDAFTREEIGYADTINTDNIKPIGFNSILPTSVFGTMALNITDSPSLKATQSAVKNELDLFVQTVEKSGGNPELIKAHAAGKYDTVLLHYFSVLAKKQAMQSRKDIAAASDQFEQFKREFVNGLPLEIRKDKVQVMQKIKNNSDLQMARQQLDLLIDNSLLEEENILRSITQWGFDAKRNITDVYDLMGESIDIVRSGTTIEEAVQNTIVRNDINAGNLLAWLSNDASFLGEILHVGTKDNDSPRSRYVDKNGLDRAETALNPLGVFASGDAPALYLATYAQGYSNRYVVSVLLNKKQTDITSREIQAFTQWWDATLKLEGDTVARIKEEFPDLADALDKPNVQKDILDLYLQGKEKAVEHFNNTGLLSEMTRNIPLTEYVAQDLRKRYPNLPKLLRQVDPLMSVEKLLEQKSESLLQDKHKALVNQFGDVTAPNRIIGDAKIKLLAGEKLDIVNSIRSKNLIDAMRFSNVLYINELPFEQTLGKNVAGHDPFSRYGSSITKTRRQAAILTEAMKTLVKGKMTAEVVKDKRNTVIIDGQAKQAEFISYSSAQIDQALKAADDIMANEILDDLNIPFEKKSKLLSEFEKDKESLNKALQLVPFLSKESSDYNVFKRQQVIRESMKGNKEINDMTVYEDYTKNVKPILDVLKENIITSNQNSIELDSRVRDTGITEDTDLIELDDIANDTFSNINKANERATPITNGTSVETPHAVSSVQASKFAEYEITSIRDRTDSAEPLSGVNTIDDAMSDNKFVVSDAHRRFLHGLQPLVKEGVLTNNDLILLKAVFNDKGNQKLLSSFFDSDKAVEFEINDDSFSSSETRQDFTSRIRIAHNLAKTFDEIGSLGAAGVVLEEIGHAIGRRMSNDGIADFVINAKKLLKDEKGFDDFIKLEKEIFGSEGRVDFETRSNDLKRLMNEENPDITSVRNRESFGIMYAIATLLGKNVQDYVNGYDQASMTKLNEMTTTYMSRLKSFYNLAESSPLDMTSLQHPSTINDTLKSTVYSVDNEIRNKTDNTSFPPFDNTVSFNRATENSNLEKRSLERTQRLIDESRNEFGQFVPALLTDPKDRLNAIALHLDQLVTDTSVGTLIDTPVFKLMANFSMGLVSKRFVEKMMLNLAQPFGARRFAFQGKESGPEGMSAIALMLLQMLDTKMLVSTSAFNRPLPTMQGLQVHLDGIFEPLTRPLINFKRENSTRGMGQESPYNTFVKLFWKTTMNRVNGNGRIQGWVDDATAKKVVVNEMASVFESQGQKLPFDNETQTITDPVLDHQLNEIVRMVKIWSNPKDGILQQILTAQVDNGTFDSTFAAEAITQGVVPIKLSDDVFGNTDLHSGIDSREKFRASFADHLYKPMVDNNNKFIHEDLFMLVYADKLVGDDLNAPEAILDLPAGAIYQQYKDKFNNRHDVAWKRFTADIKSGKITKFDLLGSEGDNIAFYYDMINKDNIELSERQFQMKNIIQEKQKNRTPRSGKKAVTNRRMNRLTELVAEEYIMRSGSSAYSFVNDRFINTADLIDDPAVSAFINMDPFEIFDSVKRGQAGQAFDKQIMGNSLGMQGFGVGDLISLLRNMGDESMDIDHAILNSELQVVKKRTLSTEERKKYDKSLEYIQDAYNLAMGTLSYDKTDKDAVGFISFLTTVADAGTALSVGPRLAMAALLEETPMALIGELKSTLGNLQAEGRKAIGNFTNKDELADWVSGMGFITRDLQYESNRILAKIGLDPSSIKQNTADKSISKIYNVGAIGLNNQTNVNRARGVRKWIAEINTMFMETSDIGTVSFTNSKGQKVTVNTENTKVNASFDLVTETIAEMGDLNNYTTTEIKEVLKQLKISDETMDAVIDMMKNGLFSEELAPIFKELWSENYETIIRSGIPFEEMMKKVSFSYNSDKKTRAKYLQVIMAMREIGFNAATRYAKQPTLSENASIGSRPLGAFSRLSTTLTNYSSSVFGSLRKSSTVSGGLLASAFLGHAISGYMYYKLVQMQNSKSFGEILKDWENDPMQEIRDALMSVPSFGMNQMVITAMLQVLRGERPSNTQIFNYASLSMINRILQLPAKTVKNIGKMQNGDILTGAAGLSSTIPLPYMPIVSMGLRSFDPKVSPVVNFSGNLDSVSSMPNRKETTMPSGLLERKPEETTTREAPPTETTPSKKLDDINKTPEGLTEALNQTLDQRRI